MSFDALALLLNQSYETFKARSSVGFLLNVAAVLITYSFPKNPFESTCLRADFT